MDCQSSITCFQVWGVVPTSLVEAERHGATFVQKLTKMDTSSSNGTAVTDGNKKANGHKEEGWFPCFLLHTNRWTVRQTKATSNTLCPT